MGFACSKIWLQQITSQSCKKTAAQPVFHDLRAVGKPGWAVHLEVLEQAEPSEEMEKNFKSVLIWVVQEQLFMGKELKETSPGLEDKRFDTTEESKHRK